MVDWYPWLEKEYSTYRLLRGMSEDPNLGQPLYGQGGLDSFGLVDFIMHIEDALFRDYQRSLVLADHQGLASARSPFRTLPAMAAYLQARLEESLAS